MTGFSYYMPVRILFGSGCLDQLSQQQIPGKTACIITTGGQSVFRSGAYERTVAQLEACGIPSVLFNRIQANPLRSTIMEGASFVRENGCDLVVALGGGSVMDAAKIIAFMAVNPGDVWDYLTNGSGKKQPAEHDPLPLICITTTAGTGSEANHFGVVSHEEQNEKLVFDASEKMFPFLSIVDPELMLTIPPALTAYQGFDALFHAVECYISRTATPVSDMYAAEAIKHAAGWLARAVADGAGDLEAREHVALANTLSGIVVNMCCTTGAHAIEHSMSAFHHDLPHGAGLIMIAPAFYEYFISRHVLDERFTEMARLLGNPSADKPEDFLDALSTLLTACHVDGLKMSEYGLTPDEFGAIAENALETQRILIDACPCELPYEGCLEILEKSYR